MNPADKRLMDLVDKWLASLELHLKYSGLDDASYWRVQPWVEHDRPSRWIIELARQKAAQLKEQIEARIAMGDAKFGDSLELMAFLSNLVGAQHVERFIPLADAASEVDLSTAPPPPAVQAPAAPAPSARTTPPAAEVTQQSAVRTQPRKAVSDTTREMPRVPTGAAAREPSRHATSQRTEARKGTTRREHKAPAPAPKAKAEQRANPEREKAVVADAVRLLGWGRKWHEIPDLISRMADRPAISEVRRILRDHKPAIERELDRDG
ncbi:MAG TPA: hypothetical protein VKB41_05425 [Steroidobacteraceae bacterium]|nr:hypothetical protein [Steroidobacteraceae bacterium]